ncbi:MAG: hypothetical protein ACOCT0_03255 [Halobacteriota archaeon]
MSFGVAVESSDGWFLVRPSGTEPLVRVYGEASEELLEGVREAVESEVSRAK